MKPVWKVQELVNYIGKDRSTIQRWANRFAWALSESAQPGRDRQFMPQDVAIMVEIKRQLDAGAQFSDIEGSIRDMVDRHEFDEITEYPPPLPPPDEGGLITLSEHNQIRVQLESTALQAIERAKKAEHDLHESREEVAALNRLVDELRRQLDEGKMERQEIIRLNREIAKLELLLEQARDKNEK